LTDPLAAPSIYYEHIRAHGYGVEHRQEGFQA